MSPAVKFDFLFLLQKTTANLLQEDYWRWGKEKSSQPKRVNLALAGENTGRNDPCPCGSDKKYKKCCGA